MEYNQGRSLFRWLRPSRRLLKWCGLILLVAFLAAFIGMQLWIHDVLKPNVLRHPNYGMMKTFWDTTLDFPEEYITGVPVSDELTKAYEKVAEEENKNPGFESTLSILQIDWNLSLCTLKPDYKKLRVDLQSFEPYIEAGLNLSRQIEQDLQPVSPGDLLPLYPPDGKINRLRYFAVNTFRLKMDALFYEGNKEEAFEYYLAAILLCVNCPYQHFDDFESGVHSAGDLLSQMKVRFPSNPSQERLEKWLLTLNRIEPLLFQDVIDRVNTLSLISRLKQSSKSRNPIDISPGKKAGYYVDLLAKARYSEMHWVQNLPRLWQKLLSGERIWMNDRAGFVRPFTLSNAPNEYFYLQTHSSWDSTVFKRYYNTIHSRFDMLRLQIAAKLYELETGKKVTATADLVPEYFPEEIINQSTKAPYVWEENGELSEFQ